MKKRNSFDYTYILLMRAADGSFIGAFPTLHDEQGAIRVAQSALQLRQNADSVELYLYEANFEVKQLPKVVTTVKRESESESK